MDSPWVWNRLKIRTPGLDAPPIAVTKPEARMISSIWWRHVRYSNSRPSIYSNRMHAPFQRPVFSTMKEFFQLLIIACCSGLTVIIAFPTRIGFRSMMVCAVKSWTLMFSLIWILLKTSRVDDSFAPENLFTKKCKTKYLFLLRALGSPRNRDFMVQKPIQQSTSKNIFKKSKPRLHQKKSWVTIRTYSN